MINLEMENWQKIGGLILFFLMIFSLSFFNKNLFVELLFICLLTVITFFILFRLWKIKDKKVYLLFLIALLIHSSVVLFIYYIGFRPFGGGADFEGYHQTARVISQRIKAGIFSLEGLYSKHYYPVIIGLIYFITLPEMLIGQLFSAWLAAVSVMLVYFLFLEICSYYLISDVEKQKKITGWAFLAGLIISIYPSYLYFGSLLLKDTVIIPLILGGLLLAIKITKEFSWIKFLFFFLVLTSLIHFRFYIGFSLMFSFVISWFLLSSLKIKERVFLGLILIVLIGFSPQLCGYGYYGIKMLKEYLSAKNITNYREIVYNPPTKDCSSGMGSSFVVKTGLEESSFAFIKNYFLSFIYTFLGPLPWQMRCKSHFFALVEMIPWWLLLFYFLSVFINIINKNGVKETLKKYKETLPLLFFSLIALGALSLFINNFGIIVRIRIPSFICILLIILYTFSLSNVKNPLLLVKTNKKLEN